MRPITTSTTTLAAVLAALAITPVAAHATTIGGFAYRAQSPAQTGLPDATDRQYLVPAGKVEHRVSAVEVSGTKAKASSERQELWLSANRARMVVTDAKTGKLRTEITDAGGVSRIFDAATGKLTVLRTKATTPPYTSAAFEAALYRAYVQQGMFRVAGEQTIDGRRRLTLASVPGKTRSSDPGSSTTAVVDADDYRVREIVSQLPEGAMTQKVTVQRLELLGVSRGVTAKLSLSRRARAAAHR